MANTARFGNSNNEDYSETIALEPLQTSHNHNASPTRSVPIGDKKGSQALSQKSQRSAEEHISTIKNEGVKNNVATHAVDSSEALKGASEGQEAEVGEGNDDDEIVYPGGFQLFILTLGLCLTTFTVALDNTSTSVQASLEIQEC
jgi:hypothetical protein